LRDRAADFTGGVAAIGGRGVPADPVTEAGIALQQLGYKPAEVARMLKEAAPDDTAEAIIRKALKSVLRSG
jgi:Holliday junction DNA helicase RuvA